MKINDVKVYLLTSNLSEKEKWTFSGGSINKIRTSIIKIKTDEGIYGVGEIGESYSIPQSCKKIVEERFAPMLLGEDPFNIERLWHKMYMRTSDWGRKGIVLSIISGIDIALWDIVAKSLNKPLFKLLGGACRDLVRVYASAGMEKPVGEIIKEVEGYLEKGYTAIKVRIGLNFKRDYEVIQEIRKSFGYDLDLMVDAGQGYVDNPWTDFLAIQVAKKLEKFDLFWLEEPLHPDNIDGYRRLCNATSIPIATGENECTLFGFKDLISPRAADILQPDVTRAGGISECKKIAALASTYQLPVAPHTFGSGVSFMANFHFIVSTANILIMEHDCTANPLRDLLIKETVEVKNGFISLPTKPGLGIEINDDIEKKFPFEESCGVEKENQKNYGKQNWLNI